MITCPWCGTRHTVFQPNCHKCGGSLPLPEEIPGATDPALPVPPPAPREVPRRVLRRILLSDGWGIAALVFLILGTVFTLVGIGLAVPAVTRLIGATFLPIGVGFLAGGLWVGWWRYGKAQQTLQVLREGQAVRGEIVDVYENVAVQVNGRFPWTIRYRFDLPGREYEGKVTALSRPMAGQEPGKPVYVLYLADRPDQNTIYPSPYGYRAAPP